MLPTAVAACLLLPFAAVAYWRLPFVDLGAIVGIPIDFSEGEILGIVKVSLRPKSLPKGSNEIRSFGKVTGGKSNQIWPLGKTTAGK